MTVVRKKVTFPGDSGVETGWATNVSGTVKGIGVADLVTLGTLTLSIVPDKISDTGVVWGFATRSTDTGYDQFSETEQVTLSGDRIKVVHDGAAGGGSVYFYVDKT